MSVPVESGIDAGLVWHAGDPFGEQRAMLAGQGWLDLSNREVLQITGPDRLDWLQSLTTHDFGRRIAAAKRVSTQPASQDSAGSPEGFTALILSPTGHVQHWVRGFDDGEQTWLWTQAGNELAAWLDSMRFLMQVQVIPREDLIVRWQGDSLPLPADVLADLPSEIGTGRELALPRQDAPSDARPVGVWAYEALRIAAGVPRVGVDTQHTTIPNELGLYATALNKGCYTGQETVARVHNLGRPPYRLVRLLLDGMQDELPPSRTPIMLDGHEVGFAGSLAQHWELGPIGLGLIKRAIPTDAMLQVGGSTASQEVLVDPEVGEHFRPQLRR